MNDTNLVKAFETALSVHSPWTIDNTELIPNEKRLGNLEMHVYVSFPRGAKFTFPICGEEHTRYDTRERVWRHLNFFQYHSTFMLKYPG